MINEISNKTKENTRYELYLDLIISSLGFGYANIGTYYLKELVKMVYLEDMQIEKYNDLCIELAKRLNKDNYLNIRRTINSSIKRIDVDKAKENFYNVFNIEFDYYFTTPKHLTVLIVNTLNRVYKFN